MRRFLSRRWSVAVALLSGGCLVLSGSGCSLVFVRPLRTGADAQGQAEATKCTESRAAPVADTVLGGTLLFIAVVGLAGYSQGCSSSGMMRCFGRDIGGALAVGAGFPSAAFLGSAWYGYRKTGQCRASKTVSGDAPVDCDCLNERRVPLQRVAAFDGALFTLPAPPLKLRDDSGLDARDELAPQARDAGAARDQK